ncbi:MFS transporter [Brassicibacter mesophilus]|uniref:MFS transporter n=1 Tax=Brassicibacter mesophilus TaxID=745119 RepID=UPI003D1AC4CF
MTEQHALNKEKLWNKNFFLLWQGQLVSSLGDVAYNIALGFWILKTTGSTALMGSLMAASVLPRVLISPFAGVLADRSNRKNILVIMDLIRGVSIVFVGIAAFLGFIKIWMVFLAAIILGICGAFFNPAASSSIPDIVPKSKLMKANSVYGIAYTGTNILGNIAGGSLYVLLGAPLMFLFNGISYIISSFTEIFIKIPKIEKQNNQIHFLTDMKDGFKFVWEFKGLRYIISIAAFINFFGNMGFILLLPLFERTSWLGPEKYGFVMGIMAAGSLAGMIFTSVKEIAPSKRLFLFVFCGTISSTTTALFILIKNLPVICILLFISGFMNAIVNIFFGASVQLTVPQNMRGKVSSLLSTVLQGLTPIAMALGGVLAEFIPIRIILFTCFIVDALIFLPFAFNQPFKKFINFNPETQTLEDII